MVKKRRFCAKCGSLGEFEENICPDCSREPQKKEKTLPEACRICGRWREGHAWKSAPAPPSSEEIVCDDCAKGPERVEAIVQFRSRYIESYWEEILLLAEKFVEVERKRAKHTFVKMKGHNLEFTNKRVARDVARKIALHFNVPLETSGKLVTYNHEKGKPVRKVTYLVSLPQVKKGDSVFLDRKYKVKGVSGVVTLEDEEGRERKVTHKELQDAKIR